MKKVFLSIAFAFLVIIACVSLAACTSKNKSPKIGASFGVGVALRWEAEAQYMQQRAKELGAELEVRINKTDEPKTQYEDCVEMIDSGIDVLILVPRDVTKAGDIIDYAKSKNVPVISYARTVLGQKIDLLVGYDSEQMGQKIGQYLAEMVYKGDFILLQGDEGDSNAKLLNDGAMRYIDPIRKDINVIAEASIAGWSPDEAKKIVTQAIKNNNNKVDAILAPNDKIAGVCAEAVEELGVEGKVIITGMDAELDAIKRIIDGRQSMTIQLDLKKLATTAIDQAYNFATGQKVIVNAQFNNQSDKTVDANLIVGNVITKENIDKKIIDAGIYTKEEVYN